LHPERIDQNDISECKKLFLHYFGEWAANFTVFSVTYRIGSMISSSLLSWEDELISSSGYSIFRIFQTTQLFGKKSTRTSFGNIIVFFITLPAKYNFQF